MTDNVVHGPEPVVGASGFTPEKGMCSTSFYRRGRHFEQVLFSYCDDHFLVRSVGCATTRESDANAQTTRLICEGGVRPV